MLYSPGYQSLFTFNVAYRLCIDLQLYPTYHLRINISWGEDISAPLYTPTCLVVGP